MRQPETFPPAIEECLSANPSPEGSWGMQTLLEENKPVQLPIRRAGKLLRKRMPL